MMGGQILLKMCAKELSVKTKMRFLALIFAAAAMSSLNVWGTVLPDACGDDKVRFEVTTQKDQPPPAGPEAGKAQVVFVESMDMHGQLCIACAVTARLGVDGQWVGASKGNSYFAIAVAPGEHHLCADWQSNIGKLRSKVSLASFSAEPGKVYYYQVKIVSKRVDDPNPDNTFEMSSMSEDEGKYGVKISALSKATLKH
jgi:hypothetical protein